MTRLLRGLLIGAAAGAAGTTALNVVTYADMAARGRPASSTPQGTVEELSKRAHVRVPGEGDTRQNRLAGLGALAGLVAGVGAGAVLGLARGAGWRPSIVVGGVAATGVAMVAGNGPMTVLGITDPRAWATADWVSDVVPHVAYGVVAAAVLDGLDRA